MKSDRRNLCRSHATRKIALHRRMHRRRHAFKDQGAFIVTGSDHWHRCMVRNIANKHTQDASPLRSTVESMPTRPGAGPPAATAAQAWRALRPAERRDRHRRLLGSRRRWRLRGYFVGFTPYGSKAIPSGRSEQRITRSARSRPSLHRSACGHRSRAHRHTRHHAHTLGVNLSDPRGPLTLGVPAGASPPDAGWACSTACPSALPLPLAAWRRARDVPATCSPGVCECRAPPVGGAFDAGSRGRRRRNESALAGPTLVGVHASQRRIPSKGQPTYLNHPKRSRTQIETLKRCLTALHKGSVGSGILLLPRLHQRCAFGLPPKRTVTQAPGCTATTRRDLGLTLEH